MQRLSFPTENFLLEYFSEDCHCYYVRNSLTFHVLEKVGVFSRRLSQTAATPFRIIMILSPKSFSLKAVNGVPNRSECKDLPLTALKKILLGALKWNGPFDGLTLHLYVRYFRYFTEKKNYHHYAQSSK